MPSIRTLSFVLICSLLSAGCQSRSVAAVAPKVPAAAGTGSVDHAAGRADLDPGDSAAILGVANRGDDAIRQLTACQAYVKKVVGE